jgi:methyl-accepting chemotaxis protein
VADEVRKLAERSATSTREITAILSAIRRETVQAAASMRASNAEMEDGFVLANRANAALQSIEAKIAETSRVAAAIVAGSKIMRAASERASAGIDGVSAIIEENASAAAQAGSTTGSVHDSLTSATAHSRAQSDAAGDVASAVLSLAAQVQEMDATAQNVRGQADGLNAIVHHFRIAGVQPDPATESRKLDLVRSGRRG